MGWWAAVLSVTLALPLATFGVIGSYARYTADDFCWAGVLRTQGFLKAQELWYVGYSPRYAFTFLVNLVELAGPSIVPALPLAAILVWSAVLAWVFSTFGWRGWRAVILAETTCVSVLVCAPDLPQSLYWQTGMLTYTLPLILASVLLGWVRRASLQHRPFAPAPQLEGHGDRGRGIQPWSLAAAVALTFVAGGLSETYLVPQNVALTLALVVAIVSWRMRPSRSRLTLVAHLVAALLGGVLALVAILVAPATAYRVGGSPADLWLTLSASIATAAYGVLRVARFFPHAIVLCLLAPTVLRLPRTSQQASCPDSDTPHRASAATHHADAAPASASRASQGLTPEPLSGASAATRVPRDALSPRALAVLTAGVAILLPFCSFPSFFAQNGNPPARSQIVPTAILIAYLLSIGIAVSNDLAAWLMEHQPSAVRRGLKVLIALVPLAIVLASLPQIPPAAALAAQRDEVDAQIRRERASGTLDVHVPDLPPYLGEHFVGTDPTDWFNVCVARYYDLRTIASTP